MTVPERGVGGPVREPGEVEFAAVVRHLSPEWMALLATLAAEIPEIPGASARLQYVITGAPQGEIRYYHQWRDGRTVTVAPGVDPEADVTYTLAYAAKVQVDQGQLDANVAFMQGRMKLAGDMTQFVALLGLTNSPEYQAVVTTLGHQTAF